MFNLCLSIVSLETNLNCFLEISLNAIQVSSIACLCEKKLSFSPIVGNSSIGRNELIKRAIIETCIQCLSSPECLSVLLSHTSSLFLFICYFEPEIRPQFYQVRSDQPLLQFTSAYLICCVVLPNFMKLVSFPRIGNLPINCHFQQNGFHMGE